MLAVQVIPTVGVEGEDGDKRRLAMLKHFSRLVDPVAKKAQFLSAFQKKPSSALQDDLPVAARGSLKAAPSCAHADENAVQVKEEEGRQPGGNCLAQSGTGAVKQEKDLSSADIKADGQATEDQTMKDGAAQAEISEEVGRPGRGRDPESEVDISISDSDVKPEDLQAVKEELADCLQDDTEAGESPKYSERLQGQGVNCRESPCLCQPEGAAVCLFVYLPALGVRFAFFGECLNPREATVRLRLSLLQTRKQKGLIWRRVCSS